MKAELKKLTSDCQISFFIMIMTPYEIEKLRRIGNSLQKLAKSCEALDDSRFLYEIVQDIDHKISA